MLDWFRRTFGAAKPPVVRRSYEGATHNRTTHGWHTSPGSANADNLGAIETLRQRSRQAWRDQPLAVRGLSLLTNALLGEAGLQPRFSAITDPGLRDAAAQLWKEWAEICDNSGTLGLLGVEHTIFHGMYESGGSLIRYRYEEPQPGVVPLTLQPIEPDYLSESVFSVPDGHRVYGGVEVDGRGRVVAYHLYRDHPGDSWNVGRPLSIVTDRVSAEEVSHVFLSTRAGQLLGVPAMHAAMVPMRTLDDYQSADLARLRAQATLVAVVRGTGAPTASSLTQEIPGGFGTVLRDSDGRTIETLEPASVYYADGAEEVKFTSPANDPNYPKTVESWQRLMAVAMGLQYTDLSGDLSAVNYSSYRAGHLTQRTEATIQRVGYIHPRFCVPLWRHWRTAAATVDAGLLALPRSISWTEPKFNSVDPLKDALAAKELIQMGAQALSHAIERSGNDPAEVFAALRADKEKIDELGLTLSSILATPTQNGGAP